MWNTMRTNNVPRAYQIRPRNILNKTKSIKRIQKKNKGRCLCCGSMEPINVPSTWNELRVNKQLCDGTLKSSDRKTFYIHRVILSAISPYFKACFTNALHNGDSEVYELVFDEVASEDLRLIVEYAYTGKCSINSFNVRRLLETADKFNCIGIIDLCCQFLLADLKPENCLGTFQYARDYFCHDLEAKGHYFICHNFEQILQKSTEFVHLGIDELCHILSDDQLNTKSEETVFEAICKWICHDSDNRIMRLTSLLSCIRFGSLSEEYFNNKIKAFPYNTSESMAFLETVEMLLSPDYSEQDDIYNNLNDTRIPYDLVFAIGGWSLGSPTNYVEVYDVRADQWGLSTFPDTVPRAYHGIVVLDNLIYMVGGFDGNEHFNTMRCFDPVSKTWSDRACMYNARCYVSVCELNGEIYAMGGYNGRTRMNSVEKYTPSKNQWKLIASMNKQRSDASCASLYNKIYIAGGFNGQEVLCSAEVYSPITQQWTYISNMMCTRSGVSLVAHRGYIFALGGFDGVSRLQSGEKYNPNLCRWETIPEMILPRSNFATAIVDDKILVVGGFNGSVTLPLCESFDVNRNEWCTTASMNLTRSALAIGVCKGLVNTREYIYRRKDRKHCNGGLHESSGDTGQECPWYHMFDLSSLLYIPSFESIIK